MRNFLLILISLCGFAQAAILPITWGPKSKIEFFSPVDGKNFFPKVNGVNLEGKEVNLPTELDGKKKLLIIAYKRKQQEDINTWLEATTELLKEYPDFTVYEIPTIKEMNFLMRFNINNGMRYGIPSKEQRLNTITLYINKEKFNSSLNINSEDSIYAFLLNQENEIIWRAEGLANPSLVDSLKARLN